MTLKCSLSVNLLYQKKKKKTFMAMSMKCSLFRHQNMHEYATSGKTDIRKIDFIQSRHIILVSCDPLLQPMNMHY